MLYYQELVKKKFIILWPWHFKKKDWYRYEISNLLKFKSFSVEIHEMAEIIEKRLRKVNCKNHKIIKKFRSIKNWYNYLLTLSKNNRLYILSEVRTYNFKSFLIKKKLYSLKNKITILEYSGINTPLPKVDFFKNIDKFIISIIFSPSVLLNYIKIKFFYNLDKSLNFSPNYTFLTTNNLRFLNFKSKSILANSLDYSNNMNIKNKNKKKDFSYAIYLDYPLPHSADSNFLNLKYPISLTKWFGSLKIFFKKIEKNFNVKILIFPHPKNNIKYLKKYYKNQTIIKNEIGSFAKHAKFFICRNSTAISYAIMHKKPIIFICSNELFKYLNYKDRYYFKSFTDELKLELTNIDKPNIIKFNKYNKKYYNNYIKKFLTSKKNLDPNYKIVDAVINNT